jgi:hypothetical protein
MAILFSFFGFGFDVKSRKAERLLEYSRDVSPHCGEAEQRAVGAEQRMIRRAANECI